MTPTQAAAPGGLSVAMADLPFRIDESALIPLEDGQAVSAGWPESIGGRPLGVTWHWTVTWDLELCRRLLGGRNAERRGEASAHYGIGRGYDEGVDRYVTLENRSWHAGLNQTLRWDGRPLGSPDYKGSRSTIGVETVNIGYATADDMVGDDWIETATPDGKPIRVQPWTGEQVAMMISIGREIVERWPHIGPDDHHGHHDLCPGYKVDVSGFPFARVLRGIYPDRAIDDVWTPTCTVTQRQTALAELGYDLGPTGVDGQWGPRSGAALKRFQTERGLVANGYWSTFVSRRLAAVFAERGMELAEASS
ncbi:peptidoglycan recognition protein family protein [Longimicrobium sp.]|uniref:peptidoglycan recognition protein family protein n=1 Tax=Longimicrobium sp. TaxID=2029185 RepID=UPI002C352341|nr:N-acetylmuramoyl-L-alanine amidase [Longimicrobium sp.]HSU16812.1 N-acetylmuramoyl-L-alanine amidase [Longimicrobium sp.]